ncbi:MAG: entericidin A/B family lipoprotein [Desulfuromonadales bacterium]|jgi:predicted small secreted protein
MKKALLSLVMVLMVLTLSACETMKGFGKDVEDAGEWVQDKAN